MYVSGYVLVTEWTVNSFSWKLGVAKHRIAQVNRNKTQVNKRKRICTHTF